MRAIDAEKFDVFTYNDMDDVDMDSFTLGVEYEITAEEQINKYGTSYKVLNIKRDIPTTAEGTYLFLSEILTENQARVLIENYPNIIQKVKDNDLDDIDLSKLKGIGEKTFAVIKDKIIINYCLMDLVIEFKNVLSMNIIKRIYDEYSSIDKLKEKLKTQPYATLTRISRIGFKTADSIILQLQKENIIDFGYDVKTSPDRCLSCILFLLEQNENDGHTKMNLADLRKQCLNTVPACAEHFVNVIKDDSVYYNKETMDVSLRNTYETEKYIADTILLNLQNANNIWEFETYKYKKVGDFELSDEQMQIVSTPYYTDAYTHQPRYYQAQAINNTIEAIAKGENRILIVMATGTGKTVTAFQIIHRLRAAGLKKKILYLADRNILIDQTITQDFRPFKKVMTKVQGATIDSAYEIYMALYHQLVSNEEHTPDPFTQVKPDFFDLIIVDECHRGSAKDDSAWRKVLEYFNTATQIGMTATPKAEEGANKAPEVKF